MLFVLLHSPAERNPSVQSFPLVTAYMKEMRNFAIKSTYSIIHYIGRCMQYILCIHHNLIGTVGVIWIVIWIIFAASSPEKHPTISSNENKSTF